MSRPPKGVTAAHRFWAKVEKSEACWLWIGRKQKQARKNNLVYGVLKIGTKSTMVHRFSFELHNGPIPDGQRVLHRCDVPLCVRPEHLFLGTQSENMQDCKTKDRHARGARLSSAKLNDEQVAEVRRDYQPWVRGKGMRFWAAKFHVAVSIISDVVNNKRWKHVTNGNP